MKNGTLMKTSQRVLPVILLAASNTMAALVTLQQPTATFSQTGYTVAHTIDGSSSTGWAIDPNEFAAQTGVWETATDVGGSGGASFTFSIAQSFSGSYTLGHFRLSFTTADRGTFADGVTGESSGPAGDVGTSGIWTQLTPLTAADAGAGTETFTINGDNTISVTGDNPDTATYIVTASTTLTGITGVRLEALKYTNPAENNGPGRASAANGNFVISEFQVDAENIESVPEPASLTVLLLGGLPALLRRRRTVR